MSATLRSVLASAAMLGVAFGASAANSTESNYGGSSSQRVVGVWHCDVTYTIPLPPPLGEFDAALMFSKDGNMSIVGSNDHDGLITDPAYLPLVTFTTSKTPAYGSWETRGRRDVRFAALYYDSKGLLSGDQSGFPSSITKLLCEVSPGRFEMEGACFAEVYNQPGADPINGEPDAVLFDEGPIFTAECDRLLVD